MRRITIREVAQHAGVSYQTVSRVLNNSHEVADATREQVQRAIQELNYHPNAQAVSLSRNRSNIVGLVIHNVGDNFFSQIVAGACQALERNGRYALLMQSEALGQTTAVEALLQSRRIDGLIIDLPLFMTLERTEQFAQKQLPIVLLDLQYDIDIDHVRIDNYQGAYCATQHLIELGHRRIGMIAGGQNLPVGHLRINGYRAALRHYGIADDPALIFPGAFDVAAGVDGAHYLLGLATPPSAIFASNDLIAFGAMQVLYERGLRIPQDLSLIGFDDIPQAAYVFPPLTTMRQPLREIGRLGGEHICRVLDGTAATPLRCILTPELVIRKTTYHPKSI